MMTGMENTNRYVDIGLITAFIVMILVSALISWHRLVIKENFTYVILEEDTPERLDLSTY